MNNHSVINILDLDRDENAADNILAEGKRMVELQKVNSNSDEFQIAP